MASPFEVLLDTVRDKGLEAAFRTFYGIYRGIVMRNDDPEERHRIQITCPEVGHDPKKALDVWVSPATDVTGERMGWFNPPLVGSFVRVVFDHGDPSKPKAYFGGWFTEPNTKSPVPSAFGYVDGKPQKRGFRSRAGHQLLFNDAPGEEKVSLTWHKIADGDPAKDDPDKVAKDIAAGDDVATLYFDEKGIQLRASDGSMLSFNVETSEIMIQSKQGYLFTMTSDGVMMSAGDPADYIKLDGAGSIDLVASKNVNINAPNINLKGAGVFLTDLAAFSPLIAEIVLPWLASHIHTATGATAPTTPPTVPPPPAGKSQVVKIK